MLQNWESVHVEVTVWVLDAVIHPVISWESVPGPAVIPVCIVLNFILML